MNITNYLKAGYPAIYIVTQEAERAMRSINAKDWKSYSWDCLRGVTDPETGHAIEDVLDPLGALKWLCGQGDSIMIVQNFHHFMGSVEIIQEIQNSMPIWKAQGSCLVIAGPHVTLPQEVEKYFTLLDFNLPALAESLHPWWSVSLNDLRKVRTGSPRSLKIPLLTVSTSILRPLRNETYSKMSSWYSS